MGRKKKPTASTGDSLELDPLDDFPTEPEPEAESEPEVESEPEEKPKPKPLRPEGVSIQVFAQVGGFKPDQLAGFASYAKTKGLGPMGVKAWREEYAKFLRLPA